jgi:hypothetical protein
MTNDASILPKHFVAYDGLHVASQFAIESATNAQARLDKEERHCYSAFELWVSGERMEGYLVDARRKQKVPEKLHSTINNIIIVVDTASTNNLPFTSLQCN